MQESAAKELLSKTFSLSFDKDRFRQFTKELLKDFEEKTFVYSGSTIPDAYRESISTLERVGKFVDKDGQKIDILIVRLCKETSLENARTRQRNFIAWYLEHSRKGNPKDAGLVAFVSPDAADWRLSLVKMEYNLVQAESGKVKAEKHLTPARRFSFLVGKTENTHTAQSRFLPLLLEDDKYPTLQDLGAAFSVEAITEEFFDRYRELFLQLEETIGEIVKKDSVVKNEFGSKGITTIDFAKKLLGQIVFLYFIQKKGWLGVERDNEWGTGPKDFLRKLFNKKVIKYKNFFNDALEFLFYDMLAVDKGAACWHEKFNCRIPFLNGGLFEPIFDYDWRKTEIVIPDEVFSNRTDPNDLESGSGILDIFDRYNFTVKEDEPLEKEVAVDPELLGKVFENLLEVKDRKSKGSYYTPREVVHYMCQESLISYLANGLAGEVTREDLSAFIKYGELGVFNDARVEREGRETETYFYKIPEAVRDHAQEIDELLKNIKVCDPAVGSGAFPMGMINEIVRARWSLNPFLFDGLVEGIKGREFYDLKWHTIQESIYGVDLDAGAVEIAKLRLWLSLVVDEQSVEKIRPLPNLDFKIMQGNSLLEEFEGLKLFDERLVRANADIDQQIEKLKMERTALNLELKEAFAKSGVAPKDEELSKRSKNNEKLLAALIKKKESLGRAHQTGFSGFGNSAAEKLEHLKRLQRQFFTTSHKSDKERLRKELDSLEWELIEVSLKEQGKADSLDKLKHYQRLNSKPYFLWQLNFSEVFEAKGGFDLTIANPPYVNAMELKRNLEEAESQALRQRYTTYKGAVDLYVLFFERGVKLLKKDGLLTYISPNKYLSAPYGFALRHFLREETTVRQFVDLSKIKIFADVSVYPILTFVQKGNNSSSYTFTSLVPELPKLAEFRVKHFKAKEYQTQTLSEFPECVWGPILAGGYDLIKKIVDRSVRLCDVCKINATTTAQEADEYSKLLSNASKDSHNLKVVNTGTIEKYTTLWGFKALRNKGDDFLTPYLNTKKAVSDYRLAMYRTSKVIFAKMARTAEAFLDLEGDYAALNVNCLYEIDKRYDLKYVGAFCNSKVFDFIYGQYFGGLRMSGGYFQYQAPQLRLMVLPMASPTEQGRFVILVDKILKLRGKDPFCSVDGILSEIDLLFTDLLGLTDDEKSLVLKYADN